MNHSFKTVSFEDAKSINGGALPLIFAFANGAARCLSNTACRGVVMGAASAVGSWLSDLFD